MPAFILCGGLGTRLRSMENRPKAIVPVAGLPFLQYMVQRLHAHGFTRLHLLLGHGAEEILDRFSDPLIRGHIEATPLGTGGALAAVRAEAARENLILNGDSYAEVSLIDLLAAHRARGDASVHGVTLAALEADDAADYGRIEIDPEAQVGAFQEKGRGGPGWINAGIYVGGSLFFRDLPAGRSSLENDILPALARRGLLWALRGRFFFRDIGTPERLAAAQGEFRSIRDRMEAS